MRILPKTIKASRLTKSEIGVLTVVAKCFGFIGSVFTIPEIRMMPDGPARPVGLFDINNVSLVSLRGKFIVAIL